MPEAGPYIVMGAAGDRHDFSDDVGGGAEMAVIQTFLEQRRMAARKSFPE